MTKLIVGLWLILTAAVGMAQSPQSQEAPVFSANAKYSNGVAPGYAPCGNGATNCTAITGLNLQVGPGTVNCGGTVVEYAGGTLTLTASATNYLYLNTAANCAPALTTTSTVPGSTLLATVITNGTGITSIDDNRTPFSPLSAATLAAAVTGTDSSSTANVYTVALNPSPFVISTGTIVNFLPHAANTTTTPTLTVAPGSAAVLTKTAGAVLAANDMLTTVVARAQWNGAGWTLLNAQTSSGGGGISALTSDVAAAGTGSVSATVQGLKSVPFCTGYTPTNGQVPEFITTSSPNPCYGAVTPGLPAGVSSDSNNGLIVSGSSQVGTLQKIYKCVNADPTDGNAINAMLANGLGVYLTTLGKCAINTVTIVAQTGQTVDMGGGTWIISPSSVPSPIWTGLLTNKAANEAPTRTCSDVVTTAGSYQITSASGCQFAQADVGQGITLTGVLPALTQAGVSIPTTLSTVIRSRVSATTVELVDPVPLAVSGVSASLYYRDGSITIRNGTIINNGPSCASGTNGNWWATVFMHINGLVVDHVNFQDGATGQSSTNGCKSVLLSMVSNPTFSNDSFLTWNLLQDGIDCFGPCSDINTLNTSSSFTGDDLIAMQPTTNGYVTTFPFQGPQHNIVVANTHAGSGTAILKLIGPDQFGYLPITNVSLVHTKCIQAAVALTSVSTLACSHGVAINDGTIYNLLVDDLSGSVNNDVQLDSAGLVHAMFRGLTADPAAASSSGSRLFYEFANSNIPSPVYSDINFDNLHYDGANLPGGMIAFSDPGASIDVINNNNTSFTNTGATSSSVPYISIFAASLGAYNQRAMYINNTQATTNNVAVYFGPTTGNSSTMALGQVNITDSQSITTVGTYGYNPYLQLTNISTSPVVHFKSNTLSSVNAGSTGFMTGTYTTGSPGSLGTPTFIFEGNSLTNVSGCFSRIGGANAYITNYQNVTSIGNVYTGLSSPTTCPPATQFGPATVAGGISGVGTYTGYDKLALTPPNAPNIGTPSQTSTGGGGFLVDNTQQFYTVCSVTSSNQVHCSGEKSITVCASATCSNNSTVTIGFNAATTGAQSYSVGRSTTSGGELTCGYMTGIQPYVQSITDLGTATCSGSALPPSTNTAVPAIVMTNSSGQTTTINPSASGSSVSVTQPSTTGTLAVTSQLSSIRAGAWSISAGTTVAVTFGTAMSAAPASCQLTTSASTATTGAPFASSLATTGFTVNVPTSGTIAGTYLCTVNGTN